MHIDCPNCGKDTDEVLCPFCFTKFIPKRRKPGMGRVEPRKKKRYQKNEDAVLDVLKKENRWMTVRDILAYLVIHQVPHQGKWPRWNYELVQTELSDLLGKRVVESKKAIGSREFLYRALTLESQNSIFLGEGRVLRGNSLSI